MNVFSQEVVTSIRDSFSSLDGVPFLDRIYNMDQTSVFFNGNNGTTNDFTGEKRISACNNGSGVRCTIGLLVNAQGRKCITYIVLKVSACGNLMEKIETFEEDCTFSKQNKA